MRALSTWITSNQTGGFPARVIAAGLLTCACLLLAPVEAAAADSAVEPVPYGHCDYYPSPDRPLGFRADGSGCYPGATPVRTWSERTPAPASGRQPQGSHHVVWRTRMPGWSETQCLVIGDRVVGLAEPDIVFCCDAQTGAVLWQDRVMPLFLGPAPTGDEPSVCPHTPAEAWRRQQVVDIARALLVRGEGLRRKREPWPSEAFKAQGLEALGPLRDRLAGLTQDPAILAGFDAYINDWAQALAAAGAVEPPGGHLKPIQEAYAIALDQVWFGWVGYVQSTPVTDGEYIYMAFGQGMVACYDLLGNRRWAWREQEFQLGGKLFCDHTPSLLLVDGVLLCRNHFGDLMGIDPATGRIRYATDIGPAYNHGAYTTPGIMRLRSPGGATRTVVVTQHDKIIDVQSGEIVATFSKEGFKDIGHGQPRMVVDDLVLIQSSQTVPPDKGPAVVLRVALADDGTVSAERVHNFAGMWFGNSPMAVTAHGDLFGHLHLRDFHTGAVIPGSVAPERNEGGGITIAGPLAFNCVSGRNPRDGWREASFGCYDVGEPERAVPVDGKRTLAFQGAPADRDADHYLPELEPAGKPGWFGLRNGGMSPSGNRLFAQTQGWLYCLGDPDVDYDWNPDSRPAALRQRIAEADDIRRAAGPVAGLCSPRTWDRAQARAALRSVPAGDRPALAQAIVERLPTLDGLVFAAATEQLGDWGAAVESVLPQLGKVADAALAEARYERAAQALQAMARIQAISTTVYGERLDRALAEADPAQRPALLACLAQVPATTASRVNAVAALLAESDAATVRAAAHCLAAWGPAAAPAKKLLLAALRGADRQTALPLTAAGLAMGASEATVGVLADRLEAAEDAGAVAAARALAVHADRILDDEFAADAAIKVLREALRERRGLVKFTAIDALGAYGGRARSAIPLLRIEANGAQCPALAERAMKRIDPDASTAISPLQDDPEPDLDLDLDLDL